MPLNEPLISVVTPAYNAARFLRETIESVRAQTYENWEMIVADDRSSDDTVRLVEAEAARDDRIRLLRSPVNRGPAPTRHAAIEAARGEYLAFLDADDLWLPGKLETQLRFMQERDLDFSFTSYRIVDAEGRSIGRPVRAPSQVEYRALLKNTIIGCLTVMLHQERTAPLPCIPMRQHVDLVIWYALLKRGLVAYGLDEDLARYRIVGNSVSRNKWRAARHMWEVYREIERLPIPDAAYCFAHYAWNAYRKNRF